MHYNDFRTCQIDWTVRMASLQIRNLPDDVYQFLAFRAERAHRSLAQQAIIELRKTTEEEPGTRRRQVLNAIRDSIEKSMGRPLFARPEDLIRDDRER